VSTVPLTGPGSRPAKPGSAAACRRRPHRALRARVGNTVPSGPAHPATTQETGE